jgi:hypothetical protein
VNSSNGAYFQSCKGVRQGGPLFPLLFNLVADCLTRMIIRAQQNDVIGGLVPHLIPKGVAILQYADDTILCLQNDLVKARSVKLILYMYEHMSGLKINFEKSEVILIGGDNRLASEGSEYVEIFNCQVGLFPIKYLGVPISPSRLHVIDWTKLEEKTGQETGYLARQFIVYWWGNHFN